MRQLSSARAANVFLKFQNFQAKDDETFIGCEEGICLSLKL